MKKILKSLLPKSFFKEQVPKSVLLKKTFRQKQPARLSTEQQSPKESKK